MILQIYRDLILPGREAAFRAIEEDAARICAELGYPNPHLAMESLSGPKEVWWLNAYESEADKARVSGAYATNESLVMALNGILARRQGVVGAPVDVFTNYRADVSDGNAFSMAGARFFVVTLTSGRSGPSGAVFEAADGSQWAFRPARTKSEADSIAAAAGDATTTFAVRPYWGMAAPEWIAADREFWQPNPMASRP